MLKPMKYHILHIAVQMQKIALSGTDVSQYPVKEYFRSDRSALDPKQFSCSCPKDQCFASALYIRHHIA